MGDAPLMPLLQNPRVFRVLIDQFVHRYFDVRPDVIAGLDARGFMMRFYGPIARSIDAPWKMYPLGLLFGLGFDTATEIAFLVLTGTSVAAGLPFWALISG